MNIVGRINRWDVLKSVFTMGTPAGDIEIKLDSVDDALIDVFIDAMKNRKAVRFEVLQ